MKNANYIGAAAALGLIASCFAPWVYLVSVNAMLTGMNTVPTHLGKPGLLNIIFAVISIVFFLLPYALIKRINVFIAAFNLSWSIRNYLIITQCQMGECPEKKFGIFILLILSFIILITSFLPKVQVK